MKEFDYLATGNLTKLAKYFNSQPQEVYQSALQFLKKLSVIRLLIDRTNNFGNQAASINLLRRLYQDGLNIKVEIIYPEEIKERLKLLLSALEPYESNITLINLDVFIQRRLSGQVSPLALGMSGALDIVFEWIKPFYGTCKNALAQFLNVDVFIKFSPYFKEYNNFELETQLSFKCTAFPLHQHNTHSQCLITPVAAFNELTLMLSNNNFHQQFISNIPALETLIEMITNVSINFLPIYGWSTRILHNLASIVLGAGSAQQLIENSLSKPLILAIFYNITERFNGTLFSINTYLRELALGDPVLADSILDFENYVNNLNLSNRIVTLSLSDVNATEVLKSLSGKQIILLYLGALPQLIFESLYTNRGPNIWPAVAEGASARNSLLAKGIPYIHCAGDNHQIPLNYELGSYALSRTLEKLSNSLCMENEHLWFRAWKENQPHQLLGQYIKDAIDSTSELSQFFISQAKFCLDPINDRIANGMILATYFVRLAEQQHNVLKNTLPAYLFFPQHLQANNLFLSYYNDSLERDQELTEICNKAIEQQIAKNTNTSLLFSFFSTSSLNVLIVFLVFILFYKIACSTKFSEAKPLKYFKYKLKLALLFLTLSSALSFLDTDSIGGALISISIQFLWARSNNLARNINVNRRWVGAACTFFVAGGTLLTEMDKWINATENAATTDILIR